MSAAPQILLLDNFDSFTYNLADYLARLGAKCHVFRNDTPLHLLTQKKYDAVLLSPGPGKPQEAGILMDVIAYYHDKLPMLGVCLGHQAIGLYFGARVCKAAKPMHGKLSAIEVNTQNILFENLPPTFDVVRYHSLLLEDLPQEILEITAQTAQAEIMAITHKQLPVSGIQFHPEAILTQYGLEMLQNWLGTV